MKLIELCQARYSCRAYKPQPIEPEKLAYIKECVRLAPSAMNLQPWRFVLITEEAQLAKIYPAYDREWLRTAPAVVLCLANGEGAWRRKADGKSHADVDVSIAIEHLVMAATEQGLGTCWICNFDAALLSEAIDIPTGYYPLALVPLGYPADQPKPKQRKATDDIWA